MITLLLVWNVSSDLSQFSLRPYHVENTGSRPITKVKQRRAWLVLRGWVTAWEHQETTNDGTSRPTINTQTQLTNIRHCENYVLTLHEKQPQQQHLN